MDVSSLAVWAIIPATGLGSRMGAEMPKQYLPLESKCILHHTLDNLLSHERICGAMVVLNAEDRHWAAHDYRHDKPVHTCTGGEQRYHSVLNGLQLLSEKLGQDAFVLIHDAVRPFVDHADLDRLIDAVAASDDGAILASPVADTLKVADDNQRISATHPRDGLWRAYTPQAFRLQLIQSALHTVVEDKLAVTDDASAMEHAGFKPRLVSCNPLNIKITYPDDLSLARLILARQQDSV